MKQTKKEWASFSFFDCSGIEAHLKQMAKKGWMLEKIGRLFWQYRRIELVDRNFSVMYFPDFDMVDPKTSDAYQMFLEMSEAAGWKLAVSFWQMQILYSDDPQAVPLETDAVVQVESIHQCAKKAFLKPQWLLVGCVLLLNGIMAAAIIKKPLAFLGDYTMILGAVLFALILFTDLMELGHYYLWKRKAEKVAKQEGRLWETHSRAYGYKAMLYLYIFIGVALLFVTYRFWGALYQIGKILLFGGLIFLIDFMRKMLTTDAEDAEVNRNILGFMTLVLAFVWLRVIPDANDVFPTNNIEKIDTKWGIQEVYRDELLLKVEDLVGSTSDTASREWEEERTIFLWSIEGSEYDRFSNESLELRYKLRGSEFEWIREKIKEEMMDPYQGYSYRLEEIAAEPWSAKTVYQVVSRREEVLPWYLVDWGDRILYIHFGWEPTAEQIEIVIEKMKTY